MTSSSSKDVYTYHFVETATGRTLGVMRIRAERVERRSAPEGAWTSTADLDDILDGGIANGLEFAFPDQGAAKLSAGSGGGAVFEALDGAAYGSLDGRTLNIGCITGKVDGFSNDNMLMVLTFTPYGVGSPSYGSSATTMFNDAVSGGTGVFQKGLKPEDDSSESSAGEPEEEPMGHGDKYVYFGTWRRVWIDV